MRRFARLVVYLTLASAPSTNAGDWSWDTTGVRGGFSATHASETFKQLEAFTTIELPWHWEWDHGWRVRTWLTGAGGVIRGGGDSGFIGQIGPLLTLARENLPVHLDLGVSPTLMSRSEYGDMDLGIPFQFTSYAGVSWDFSEHAGLGYRFQHMSNAHLGQPNPGLNLHAISVYYRF